MDYILYSFPKKKKKKLEIFMREENLLQSCDDFYHVGILQDYQVVLRDATINNTPMTNN